MVCRCHLYLMPMVLNKENHTHAGETASKPRHTCATTMERNERDEECVGSDEKQHLCDFFCS